jgi:hypothetical protein
MATGVRRETASSYLKAAGIGVRRRAVGTTATAKPANEVTTDSESSKPANTEGVTTDFIRPYLDKGADPVATRRTLPPASVEPFRESIESGL